MFEVIFYITIFIIGTLFGSFATLAIYRLPLKKDIIKERSFCPNCNHKLGFFELIPVLSYIFLGGKCKHCGEKIRIRYFLIEVISGIVAVLVFLKLQVPISGANLYAMLDLIYLIIFATTIIIIAGIDKEKKYIFRPVILFGTILCLVYMLYLCLIGKFDYSNMYRYALYFILIIFLYIVNNVKTDNYIIDLVILVEYMQLFMKTEDVLMSILLAAFITLVRIISEKTKPVDKSDILMEEEKEKIELPVAYYLGISTFIVMLIQTITIIV